MRPAALSIISAGAGGCGPAGDCCGSGPDKPMAVAGNWCRRATMARLVSAARQRFPRRLLRGGPRLGIPLVWFRLDRQACSHPPVRAGCPQPASRCFRCRRRSALPGCLAHNFVARSPGSPTLLPEGSAPWPRPQRTMLAAINGKPHPPPRGTDRVAHHDAVGQVERDDAC